MEFESLLEDVGSFGFYQKMLVCVFFIPANIVIPWFSVNVIFVSDTPDHWCYVPEIANSNLSLEVQKRLVRPPRDSSCSTYDVNFSRILNAGNLTVNPDWPTKQCSDGWQYDKTDYDETAVTRWNMVCKDAHYSSLVFSMIFIGTLFGTPLYGFLSDKFGRKPAFFTVAFLIAVSETSSIFCPYIYVFLFLKAVQGSCMIAVYSYGYVILIELVSPDVRSRINGIATICWTTGLCLLPLIAELTRNWVLISAVTASSAAAICFYWKLIPESPRWLISENRYDEAHAIMVKISKINGKTAHKGDQLAQKIKILGEKIKNQRSSDDKHSPADFFRYPTLRKRFLLISFCWMSTANVYYGLQANVKNLTGNEFLNFFLISIVELPAHFGAWMFMERCGRRWCCVISFSISSVACLIPVLSPSGSSSLSIIASLLGKVGSCSSLMTLYQQAPELFPTSLRCLGLAMCGTIGNGCALLMPYIVYLGSFQQSIPFFVFSIISFFAAICASFLPETLNKNLPQTIADGELFEKDFKYWSWSGSSDPGSSSQEAKTVAIVRCTPSLLSVTDLQASMKNMIFRDTVKSIPVFISSKPIKESNGTLQNMDNFNCTP